MWVHTVARRGHWLPWSWSYRWLWATWCERREPNLGPWRSSKCSSSLSHLPSPQFFKSVLLCIFKDVLLHCSKLWEIFGKRVGRCLELCVSTMSCWCGSPLLWPRDHLSAWIRLFRSENELDNLQSLLWFSFPIFICLEMMSHFPYHVVDRVSFSFIF